MRSPCFPVVFPLFFYALISVFSVHAQTCENYGQLNGTTCDCPTGFGGSTCSELACGGNIFQGSQRPLTSTSSGFANLTSSGCSCQSGWTGTACNVCTTANACQNAANGLGNSASSLTGDDNDGLNHTLVCNTSPQVWASSQMSCSVNNPTLQTLFPLSSTLNIIRTLDPSLSPIPNVTSFGSAGSLFAQLFYDGEEQFYCKADSCTQDTNNWSCQNLACVCITNTTFCGGVPAFTLTSTINALTGTLDIDCGNIDNSTQQATCNFKQSTIDNLFGSSGLTLNGCSFGECLSQSVLDGNSTNSATSTTSTRASLSGGVIAGLAVVGGLLLAAVLFLLLGWFVQRRARRSGHDLKGSGNVAVKWSNVSYVVLTSTNHLWRKKRGSSGYSDDKVILDSISGHVLPGQMMAILGPSGAGKTTLVEMLAGKHKSGSILGHIEFPSTSQPNPRIGFVPQQDVLPSTLTVYEALLFAARLRLPENIPDVEKRSRVDAILQKLGIDNLRDTRIGDNISGRARGISGGEMRRVSIGLELIASPDVLILDEPTSGLDSVSAARVANVLRSIAHDPSAPTAVIASIHQPSSQLYQTFDTILVLSHGHALYSGPGSFAPVDYLAGTGAAPSYQQGYNVADYLLEVASDPPLALLQSQSRHTTSGEKVEKDSISSVVRTEPKRGLLGRSKYATTFLTQLEYLSGREWKILKRDKTLFITHFVVAAVLGVFCGGLYFNINDTIAGFQSRVGCLFFLGALIAFSSLSALYNIVEIRPLFLRERSAFYYSPTAWLLSRFLFDVIPLRLVPTIVVSTITYWMAGLAPDAAHFFKFLFILVLFTLALTLFNFLLGTLFRNGGIAILLSALTALYQMTYAGFFVHLDSIPPVLRWLQWFCPLKYCLEALSVNEVGSGLMIKDTLQGVPVDVSAALIMNLLFGFGENNYYRDVLVLFAFIAGFGLSVIGVVWVKVREQR